MDRFSISDLARLSGIKQHTIRIWEQRYQALTPGRSEGNTRYYDSSQLRRLLNIVSAAANGHKVSDLCKLSDEELFSLIKQIHLSQKDDTATEFYVAQLTAAGMDYDEAWFEKTFAQCIIRFGMQNAYTQVIYPLLQRVGLLWATGVLHPAHEHFISNLLRQKMFAAIDSLPPPKSTAGAWLCFLPEDEFHEIGLLFAAYLIRQSGKKVFYLGSNVPAAALTDAVESTAVENLLTFLITRNDAKNTEEYLNNIGADFKKKKIFVAASPSVSEKLNVKKNIILLHTVDDFLKNIS